MRRFGLLSLLVGLLGGLFGLFAAPQGCLACSCALPGSPAEELARSSAVFRGRVTAITRESDVRGYTYQRVTFQADTAWKGPVSHEMNIYTGSGGGDCGYLFTQGEEYLVYAYAAQDSPRGQANALVTGICSRTRPISQAGDDLAALGTGTPPTASPLPTLPNTGGGHSPAFSAALTPSLALLALLAALLLGVGRLRRQR